MNVYQPKVFWSTIEVLASANNGGLAYSLMKIFKKLKDHPATLRKDFDFSFLTSKTLGAVYVFNNFYQIRQILIVYFVY